MTFSEIVARLDCTELSDWRALALCPAHADRNPSLVVSQADDGNTLIKCRGGCDTADVLAALGLQWRDLFLRPGEPRPAARRRPVKHRPPPPAAEVAQLWSAGRRADFSLTSTWWLEHRGLDVETVVACDLARCIPAGALVPTWATCSRAAGPWHRTGHQLMLPAFDVGGRIASLHARCVLPGISPKSAWPAGHGSAGLMLANAAGAALLRGDEGPDRLIIAEGVPDYLTWATTRDDERAALWGIAGSGAWQPPLADRIPYGFDVLIATHHDRAGNKYARQITADIDGRATVRRWNP